MWARAAGPRISPVNVPRTSAYLYGFSELQIATVTEGLATIELYLARCTSVLISM